MNDKISIIIPIYNVKKYINKCIESIINQTYKNLEIILVDDGSTDGSGKICDEFKKEDNRIVVIHKKNEGVSSARNEGLKIATGDYIGFIDADDFIEKDMYLKMINRIKKDNTKMTICNAYLEDENGVQTKNFKSDSQNIIDSYELMHRIMEDYVFQGYMWNKLYARSLIYNDKNDYLKFDTNISNLEDRLFNLQLIDKNKKFNVSFLNEKLYHYIQRESSAIHTRYNDKYFTNFYAKSREIEILGKNNFNTNEMKATFVIEFVRAKNKISIINSTSNVLENSLILDSVNKYKKDVKINKLPSNKLKMKYIVATKLPWVYKIKQRIVKEK